MGKSTHAYILKAGFAGFCEPEIIFIFFWKKMAWESGNYEICTGVELPLLFPLLIFSFFF